MKFYRTCKLAVWALRRNILRAALTTLGIVIGVAAVIAMMEIGHGSAIAIPYTTCVRARTTGATLPTAGHSFSMASAS